MSLYDRAIALARRREELEVLFKERLLADVQIRAAQQAHHQQHQQQNSPLVSGVTVTNYS